MNQDFPSAGRRILPEILFGVFLLFLLSHCAPMKNTISAGLANGVKQARVDSLIKAATDSALTELMRSDRFVKMRTELDAILHQTQDSAKTTADTLLNQIVLQFTARWLDTIDAKVQVLLSHAKDNITDDQLKQYIAGITQRDLPQALDRMLNQVLEAARSDKLKDILTELRANLDRQVDTLARSLVVGLSAQLDSSFFPRIQAILEDVVAERDKTKTGISDLLLKVGIGIIVLLVLGFLLRTWYLKRKYQRVAEVLTLEIDKIDARPVYNNLVRNISGKMKDNGLEEFLRDEILKKQGLIEQSDWKEQDVNLLNALVQEAQKDPELEAKLRAALKSSDWEGYYASKMDK